MVEGYWFGNWRYLISFRGNCTGYSCSLYYEINAASFFKKILEQRDSVQENLEIKTEQSESDAVVTEADAILEALELREIAKALSNRIK